MASSSSRTPGLGSFVFWAFSRAFFGLLLALPAFLRIKGEPRRPTARGINIDGQNLPPGLGTFLFTVVSTLLLLQGYELGWCLHSDRACEPTSPTSSVRKVFLSSCSTGERERKRERERERERARERERGIWGRFASGYACGMRSLVLLLGAGKQQNKGISRGGLRFRAAKVCAEYSLLVRWAVSAVTPWPFGGFSGFISDWVAAKIGSIRKTVSDLPKLPNKYSELSKNHGHTYSTSKMGR